MTPNTLEQFIEQNLDVFDGTTFSAHQDVKRWIADFGRRCAEKTVEAVVHADNEDALEAARAWLGTVEKES